MWRFSTLFVFAALSVARISAQEKVPCSDGDHYKIDLKQLELKYDGTSFKGTLTSLTALVGIKLEVVPQKLQNVALATQQWNEFLKGLAVGYNTCAISKLQYQEGVLQVYPRLRTNISELDGIRKQLAAGRGADQPQLDHLLQLYVSNFTRFAEISHRTDILERITNLEHQTTEIKHDLSALQAKFDEATRNLRQHPLAPPAEVQSEIESQVTVAATRARAAYERGYALTKVFRFADAIPYFEDALSRIRLPDFYIALGRAYLETANLDKAEQTFDAGLREITAQEDQRHAADLNGEMARLFLARGRTSDALRFAERALTLDQHISRSRSKRVARDEMEIGEILYGTGDLVGALDHSMKSLKLKEAIYGHESTEVGEVADNVGMILYAKRDLKGAAQYTGRAVGIGEREGPLDSPSLATRYSNVGSILYAQGDLDGALRYTHKALDIDSKIYGPNHPNVAIRENNIGQFYALKGDLKQAYDYTMKAVSIDKEVYGPRHTNVASFQNNLANTLRLEGKLDEALDLSMSSLQIHQEVRGRESVEVATDSNSIAQTLLARGDSANAMTYARQAFDIDQKLFGPDHPYTASDANTLAATVLASGKEDEAFDLSEKAISTDQKKGPDNAHLSLDYITKAKILLAKHDIAAAQLCAEDAMNLAVKAYGPNNPQVALAAEVLGQVIRAKGDAEAAIQYARQAILILRSTYGPDNPATQRVETEINVLQGANDKHEN
jgi:tetratricopeptide (TPR) repeat protein